VARFLVQPDAIVSYLTHFKSELEYRLRGIYEGLIKLKKKGLPVDAVAPEAAIYLTVKFDLVGKKAPDGDLLLAQADVTSYLLQYAHLAIVPFYAFGAPKNSPWYRLSVGTCKRDDIKVMLSQLGEALEGLR
jgi:aspartate aminotransferase